MRGGSFGDGTVDVEKSANSGADLNIEVNIEWSSTAAAGTT